MIRGRAIFASAAACAALLFCGCGDGAERAVSAPAKRSMALTIRFEEGSGQRKRGTLSCRPGRQRAAGIARPAARTCTRMRRIAAMLIAQPRKDRACTLNFGGSQRVRVSGTIGAERVNRRFTRTNGCEISDYGRLAEALPAIRVR